MNHAIDTKPLLLSGDAASSLTVVARYYLDGPHYPDRYEGESVRATVRLEFEDGHHVSASFDYPKEGLFHLRQPRSCQLGLAHHPDGIQIERILLSDDDDWRDVSMK